MQPILKILPALMLSGACAGTASQYETVRPDVVRGAVVAVKLAQCADSALNEWRASNAVSAQEAVARAALIAPAAPAPVAPPVAP